MTTKDLTKLSTEEIFSVLVKRIGSSEFELVNYDQTRADERIGFLGDHAVLSATANVFPDKDSQKRDLKSFTFFVKYFPAYEMQAVFCRETGAFKKEVFMYEVFEEIWSAGVKYMDCVPRCYFSKVNYVLVTENLSEKGYRLLDKMKTLDYRTVLVVLKSLAKLHASSIIYEEMKTEELKRTFRLLDGHEDDFEDTFYNDREGFVNLKGVEAAVKGICSEIDFFKIPKKLASGKDFKEFFMEYYPKVYDLVKRNTKVRNVLCHGDLWSTNFLIKFSDDGNPIDCKLVDFQYGRYLPPSHDVMSLLYLNTTRDFRKNHMYEILGLYYTYFEKYLKLSNVNISDILTIQDFLTSCEEQKFFALYHSATCLQLVLVDNQKLEELFADFDGNDEILSEDRTPLILGNIEDNVEYQERLRESVIDLKEYCDRL